MAVDTAKTNSSSDATANPVSFSDCFSGRSAFLNILRSSTRWPIPMETMLSDSDGVDLFNNFLVTKYASGHLLDFWFACKGFHSNVDPTNPEKLFQVAKVIYRTYIKSGAVHPVPLPMLLKQTITDRMSSYHHGYKLSTDPPMKETSCTIDRTLFDTAQENIRVLLEETYYPEFLRSFGCLTDSCSRPDLPVLDTNSDLKKLHSVCTLSKGNTTWRTCPNNVNKNTDSSSTSQDPSCSHRPTCQHCSTDQSTSQNCPALRLTTSWTNSLPQSPLIDFNRMGLSEQFRLPDTTNPCSNQLHLYSEKTDCPTKDQPSDSAKCSCSNHDTVSAKHPDTLDPPCNLGLCPNKSTLSPSNLVESGLGQRQQQQQQLQPSRPIRDYKPSVKKHSNLAESDPASFVLLLTSRLEKIKESRGKMEKLMSWVNQVDEKQNVDSHLVDDMMYKPSYQDSLACHQQSLRLDDPNQRISYSVSQDSCHPMVLQDISFEGIGHLAKNTDEDAQGILDEHFSRIWADETNDSLAVSRRKRGESAHTVVSHSSVTPYSYGQETLSSSVHVTEHDNRRKFGTRRRTAVSAVASLSLGTSKTVMSDSYSRKRTGLRGTSKPSRSDARSTASWDSGVVANCASADVRYGQSGDSNQFGEIESGSLVAAASLQALSSSTTELAVVNGELTAKLVEQMIRHGPNPYGPRTGPFSPPYKGFETCHPSHYHPSHLNKSGSGQTCDMSCNMMWNQQSTCSTAAAPDNYHSGPKLHSASCCPSCGDSSATLTCNQRHCFHTSYPISYDHSNQPGTGWMHQKTTKSLCASSGRSQSFPTASDTSSTFDSGISSTYDQLPLRIRQPNSRENRSQSLHNWQPIQSSSTDSQNRRTPSASKSNPHPDTDCTSHIHNQTGRHCCQPVDLQSELWWNDNHHMAMLGPNSHFNPNCGKCPDCNLNNKSLGFQDTINNPLSPKPHDSVHSSKTPKSGGGGSGHLLQHWLHLQSEDTALPNTAHSRSTHNHSRKSHVHHRRSSVQRTNSVTTKSTIHHGTSSDMCKDSDSKSAYDKSDLTVGRTPDPVPTTSSQTTVPGVGLVVGYYLCDDPVPYRTVWTGPLGHCSNLGQLSGSNEAEQDSNQDLATSLLSCSTTKPNNNNNPSLTLGQFKQLIAKKGVYRYFFKKPSDEFGTGVVHEELTNDDATLPLWDGKVVARIERAD